MEEHLTNNSVIPNTTNGSISEEHPFLGFPFAADNYDVDYDYFDGESIPHTLSTPRTGPCKGLAAQEDVDEDVDCGELGSGDLGGLESYEDPEDFEDYEDYDGRGL